MYATKFEMLKVKVKYLLFFSAPWVSRYAGTDVTKHRSKVAKSHHGYALKTLRFFP
jgi:hypothetical protein